MYVLKVCAYDVVQIVATKARFSCSPMAERTSQYFQILSRLFLVGSLPYKQMLFCIKDLQRRLMFCGQKRCAEVQLNRQLNGQGRKSNDNIRNHESLGREIGSSASKSVPDCLDNKPELRWSFFVRAILQTFKKELKVSLKNIS